MDLDSRGTVAIKTALALLACLACLPLACESTRASDRGYDIWFSGQIVSIDAPRRRLRIARGPTETAGRAVEECIANAADLRRVRPGMRVEAQADTRRRPWILLHLREMQLRTTRPNRSLSVLAFLATGPA